MSTTPRTPEDPWNIRTENITREEENAALALGAHFHETYDYIKSKLPPGTHFALIVDIPSIDGKDDRIMTLATNRSYMAPLAEEWAVSVLRSS